MPARCCVNADRKTSQRTIHKVVKNLRAKNFLAGFWIRWNSSYISHAMQDRSHQFPAIFKEFSQNYAAKLSLSKPDFVVATKLPEN